MKTKKGKQANIWVDVRILLQIQYIHYTNKTGIHFTLTTLMSNSTTTVTTTISTINTTLIPVELQMGSLNTHYSVVLVVSKQT